MPEVTTGLLVVTTKPLVVTTEPQVAAFGKGAFICV